MYGTGMNPYMLNHFYKVAQDMNNYVAVRSHYYPQNQYYRTGRDANNSLAMYQIPSLLNSGLSGLFAYGLHAVGMPTNIVNLGHRIGYFIDINA